MPNPYRADARRQMVPTNCNHTRSQQNRRHSLLRGLPRFRSHSVAGWVLKGVACNTKKEFENKCHMHASAAWAEGDQGVDWMLIGWRARMPLASRQACLQRMQSEVCCCLLALLFDVARGGAARAGCVGVVTWLCARPGLTWAPGPARQRQLSTYAVHPCGVPRALRSPLLKQRGRARRCRRQ